VSGSHDEPVDVGQRAPRAPKEPLGPHQTRGDSGGEHRQISERRQTIVASPHSAEHLDWRIRTRGGRGRTWIRTRRRERPRRMAIYPT
jgi:hypothetical protein